MRDDYTLVVPTYNRSNDLAVLLAYLQAQQADFRILVLDSSKKSELTKNRKAAKAVSLNIEHHEFDLRTRPFDKFRAGVEMVETPYCSLCADDDIPLPRGLNTSVELLKAKRDLAVAHGYYFQFARHPNSMNLASITYYTPDISDDEPVARVHTLMRHYQALTYGVYRTEVLQHIFDAVRPVTSLLGRELLSSALAVVRGKIARVNGFYMGRNLGPSSGHVHWHPLEWSIESPEGLFAEFARYREILAREVLSMSDNDRTEEDVTRLLDLIHLHYYVRHAPEESLDYSVEAVLEGRCPDEIFAAPEVTYPLIEAAARYSERGERAEQATKRPVAQSPPPRTDKATASLLRKVIAGFPGARHMRRLVVGEPAPTPNPDTSTQLATRTIQTGKRTYILQPGFYAPPKTYGVALNDDDHRALLTVLDAYA